MVSGVVVVSVMAVVSVMTMVTVWGRRARSVERLRAPQIQGSPGQEQQDIYCSLADS